MESATESVSSPTLDPGLDGLGHASLNIGILLQQITLAVQATVRPSIPPGLVQRKVALGQQTEALLVVPLSETGHGPVEVIVGDLQVLTSL